MNIADTIAQCCTLETATRKILVERLVASCEQHGDGGVTTGSTAEEDEDSPTSSRYDTTTITRTTLLYQNLCR